MNKFFSTFLILLVLVAVLVGGYYIIEKDISTPTKNSPEDSSNQSHSNNNASEYPTKKVELSDESEQFSISGADDKFDKVVFNPLYVTPGESQEIIVKLKQFESIEKVKAEAELDSSSKSLTFKKVNTSQWGNVFYTEWTPEGITADTFYPVEISYVTKKEKQSKIKLTWKAQKKEVSFWRSLLMPSKAYAAPCSVLRFNAKGATEIKTSCSIDGKKGVKNGNLKIQQGYNLTLAKGSELHVYNGDLIVKGTIQMNRNSTIYFSEGHKISPEQHIAKSAEGTAIKKGADALQIKECVPGATTTKSDTCSFRTCQGSDCTLSGSHTLTKTIDCKSNGMWKDIVVNASSTYDCSNKCDIYDHKECYNGDVWWYNSCGGRPGNSAEQICDNYPNSTCDNSGGGVKCTCNPTPKNNACSDCGTASDGCGNTYNCGSCGSGETCKNNNCVCASGYNKCSDGSCVNNSITDSCNGVDDDCDGSVDENSSCNSYPNSYCDGSNGCQCNPDSKSVACSGKCGNVSDKCGGTINCGSDQCSGGATRCSGNNYQECRDTNGDGCTDGWVDIDSCSYGCSNSSGCYGECNPGDVTGCSNRCTYDSCSNGSCGSITEYISGSKTCQNNYYWGACDASCPSDQCNSNSDCKSISIDLPNCSFSDKPGIYVKNNDCGWGRRARINDGPWGTGSDCGLQVAWSSELHHGYNNGYNSVNGLHVTAGLFITNSKEDWCKIGNTTPMKKCPFQGNRGTVWVKHQDKNWSQGCPLDQNCSGANVNTFSDGTANCSGFMGYPTHCNYCIVTEECNPGTCSSLGYNCGTHSDGCGGTVDCGGCGWNSSCSGGTCN